MHSARRKAPAVVANRPRLGRLSEARWVNTMRADPGPNAQQESNKNPSQFVTGWGKVEPVAIW